MLNDIMMDKRLPRIEVRTLMNGYSLAFDGMKQKGGYMYFTPEALLEGFMAHIGLDVTDQIDMGMVTDFLATAMNWRDNSECVREIEDLRGRLAAAERAQALAERRLAEKREAVSVFESGIVRLAAKYADIKTIGKDLVHLMRDAGAKVPADLGDRIDV